MRAYTSDRQTVLIWHWDTNPHTPRLSRARRSSAKGQKTGDGKKSAGAWHCDINSHWFAPPFEDTLRGDTLAGPRSRKLNCVRDHPHGRQHTTKTARITAREFAIDTSSQTRGKWGARPLPLRAYPPHPDQRISLNQPHASLDCPLINAMLVGRSSTPSPRPEPKRHLHRCRCPRPTSMQGSPPLAQASLPAKSSRRRQRVVRACDPLTPSLPPCCFSTWSSETTMRAPLQPMGCPSETAPPLTFTLDGSKSSIRLLTTETTENASLISSPTRGIEQRNRWGREGMWQGTEQGASSLEQSVRLVHGVSPYVLQNVWLVQWCELQRDYRKSLRRSAPLRRV